MNAFLKLPSLVERYVMDERTRDEARRIRPEVARMSTTLDPHAEVEKARGRAPQPPVEEQVGRLNRTRESMERHGIDVLLLYGSVGEP